MGVNHLFVVANLRTASVMGSYKEPVLQIRRGNKDNLGIISHISP